MIEKITAEQLLASGVVSAPDKLVGRPADNKAVFDRLVAELVAPKLNEVIDVENEVLTNEEGRVEAEQGRVEAENARVEAEESRETAEEERETAEQARAEAERARQDKNSGTVAQVNRAAEAAAESEKNAKYWAEQAGNSALGAPKIHAAQHAPDGTDPIVGYARTPVFVPSVLLASGWSDNTYSFEAIYPREQYDVGIEVAPTATAEQFEAFGGAMICGSADRNVATAIGDVPTVDIPIIIKVVAK